MRRPQSLEPILVTDAVVDETVAALYAAPLRESLEAAGLRWHVQEFGRPEAPTLLTDLLGGPADLVLSDMAANTTGHKKTDHLRIIGLAETAAHAGADATEKASRPPRIAFLLYIIVKP